MNLSQSQAKEDGSGFLKMVNKWCVQCDGDMWVLHITLSTRSSKIARCSSTLNYQQDSKIARCSSTLRSPSSSSYWAPSTPIGMPAFRIVSIFLSSWLHDALLVLVLYILAADWGTDMMYWEFLGNCDLTSNWIHLSHILSTLTFQPDWFWIGDSSCWCSFVGQFYWLVLWADRAVWWIVWRIGM